MSHTGGGAVAGRAAHAADAALLPVADAAVTALGRLAGPPWRRAEKDAAGAAIALLPGSAAR